MHGIRTYSVFLYCIFFISGKLLSQSNYDRLTSTPLDRNVFNDVAIGYGYFEGTHYHESPPNPGSAGIYFINFSMLGLGAPNIYASKPKHAKLYTHRSGGVGVKYIHTRTFGEYEKLTLKTEYTSGLNKELDTLPLNNLSFYDFSSSAQFDYRWFGASLGLHFGRNYQEKAYYVLYFTKYNEIKNYFAPSLSLRVFPYELFYLKVSYNEYFPFVLGARNKLSYRLSLGTGLGRKNGTALEVGYDRVGGIFCSAKWISDKFFGWEVNAFLPVTEDYTHQLFMCSVFLRLQSKYWEKKYNIHTAVKN